MADTTDIMQLKYKSAAVYPKTHADAVDELDSAIEKKIKQTPVEFNNKSIEKKKLNFGVLSTDSTSNLCNFENITWGCFPRYSDGHIFENINYCYVTADISSIEKIRVFNTTEQGCFFDAQGNYISGYTSVSSMPTTIPDGTKFIKQTFKISEISNGFVGDYADYKINSEVIDLNSIDNASLNSNKMTYLPFISKGYNLFNREVTVDRYVDYKNGTEVLKTGYSVSKFIELDNRYFYRITGTTEQLALYDSFKNYVTGLTQATQLEKTALPVNIKYIKISMKKDQLSDIKIEPIQEIDTNWITQENANKIANLLNLPNENIVSVKKDGTGDYKSLKEALTKTPENSCIEIYDDFALEDDYTEEEMKNTSFVGYQLTKNWTIKGVGDVTISANLNPSVYSYEDIKRISPITCTGSGSLINLTLVGNSSRYAFHPETYADELFCEDCNFIKKNSGTYCQAMAGGTRSGQKHVFKNCQFTTEWTGNTDIPASYHTNNNFKNKCEITFEDCSFISNGSKYELRFGGMKSGQKNIVNLIGNRLSSVYVKEEQMNGSGLDYVIRGRGNRELTFTFESKSGNETVELNFVEKVNVSN